MVVALKLKLEEKMTGPFGFNKKKDEDSDEDLETTGV